MGKIRKDELPAPIEKKTCPFCKGTGAISFEGKPPVKCKVCNGAGKL